MNKPYKLFDCRYCKGVFYFTKDIKENNYKLGIGFICNTCLCNEEIENIK